MAKLLRDGAVLRTMRCVSCGLRPGPTRAGRPRVVFHHASYQPQHAEHVVPLCLQCHGHVHTGSVPDPGLMLVTYPSASDPADVDVGALLMPAVLE